MRPINGRQIGNVGLPTSQNALGVVGDVQWMIRRVAMSSTTKTYSCWKVAVTTTKKSQARTALAWLRRNVVHDCGDRPRCGRECRGMYRRTVRGETVSPSFSRSSAAIRSLPHVRLAAAISAMSCFKWRVPIEK
jgi:hypothetical protein